jgi:tRNA uridine 5-carboxymethylaminomethyl modification enzyme
MFTSRAEYRLTLRADNADLRLTRKAIAWGCVGRERKAAFTAYEAGVAAAIERAKADGGYPAWLAQRGIPVRADGRWRSIFALAGLPTTPWDILASAFPWLQDLPPRQLNQLQAEAKYQGYLGRQQADIQSFRREEALGLDGVVYAQIGGISAELISKLAQIQPTSLGAASRIQGMTPAALVAIAAHVRRQQSA